MRKCGTDVLQGWQHSLILCKEDSYWCLQKIWLELLKNMFALGLEKWNKSSEEKPLCSSSAFKHKFLPEKKLRNYPASKFISAFLAGRVFYQEVSKINDLVTKYLFFFIN